MTPDAGELMALADRLEAFCKVLESARRCDNKSISVWSGDPEVVAEAVTALRIAASQPDREAVARGGRIEKAIVNAYFAIKSLPIDGLGWANTDDVEWPIRDQLADELDDATTDVKALLSLLSVQVDGEAAKSDICTSCYGNGAVGPGDWLDRPCPNCAGTGRAKPPVAETDADAPGGARNWKEDFSHENGQYECSCYKCGRSFIGHKRRVVCKSCSAPRDPTLSAEGMREALEAVRAAIVEAPIDVLTDTLWIPSRISPNETAVDCIDAALSALPVQSGKPGGEG